MRLSALLLVVAVALAPAQLTAAGIGAQDPTWSGRAPVLGSAGLLALRQWLGTADINRTPHIPPSPLTRGDSAIALDLLWKNWRVRPAALRSAEMRDSVIMIGDKKMRLLIRVFGTAPVGGRSLWISLHGGGDIPARDNDQQWWNQIRLYQPAEGVCIAPRAPTDHWNLWHEDRIDDLLDRLIEDCVLLKGVNPNKVYLMGYSAGGNGVYQLAPRMADRFAAASVMAGQVMGAGRPKAPDGASSPLALEPAAPSSAVSFALMICKLPSDAQVLNRALVLLEKTFTESTCPTCRNHCKIGLSVIRTQNSRWSRPVSLRAILDRNARTLKRANRSSRLAVAVSVSNSRSATVRLMNSCSRPEARRIASIFSYTARCSR